MSTSDPLDGRVLQHKTLLLTVIAVSAAFAWILWPFYGAILWAAILAIIFNPLYRRLCDSLRNKRIPAALTTLLIILLIVILPAAVLANVLTQEAVGVYARVKTGDLDIGAYLQQMIAALPAWMRSVVERFGLSDVASVQERMTGGLMKGLGAAGTHALDLGQNALATVTEFFIMLYLIFFLLLDGDTLSRQIGNALPLDKTLQHRLARRFTEVARATIKGTITIAILQGALGGIIFWFLGIKAPVFWAVVMAFLSLLPTIGTALVWLPVAIYFLLTGAIWQGVVLILFGSLVIGLVDNLVRPILVGRDTKIPDYVVLIATLGGMAIFGLNGFVIGPLIAAMFIAVWDIFASSRLSTAKG